MKQCKHILLLAALLLGSLTVGAYDFNVNGKYYNITSKTDLTVEVTYEKYDDWSGIYSSPMGGNVVIPESVTYGNNTYRVTSIGMCAFANCSGLASITIPESVTSIGRFAFNKCSSLTFVTIPESVTSIGGSAFQACSSLTSITIPASVSSIGDNAFGYCSSLTSITIPEGVTSIGSYTFYDCSSLVSITIPEGVASIGNVAFYGCSSLTAITIPKGMTNIGSSTFYGCSSLTSVTIPESVTSIGNDAFRGCSGLTSITIPAGVTSIGDYAFRDCSGLTSITCKAVTPPTATARAYYGTFLGVDKTIPVYVPAGSVEAYKAAAYWSEFVNILPLPNEYALKVSAAGYATLYLDYAAKIPDNVKAYIGTRVEGNRLMMTQVTGVLPANTGVIVRAEAGTYIFEESKDMPANVEGNLLSGTATDTYITAESGYKYYVLAQKEGLVAMYRPILTDGRFLNNANKAYIALDTNRLGIFDDETNTEDEDGQLSNRLRFDFGGTTSIQNSQFTIQNSQFIYDLHGRRVENPTKGIYIVNGRKVVVK